MQVFWVVAQVFSGSISRCLDTLRLTGLEDEISLAVGQHTCGTEELHKWDAWFNVARQHCYRFRERSQLSTDMQIQAKIYFILLLPCQIIEYLQPLYLLHAAIPSFPLSFHFGTINLCRMIRIVGLELFIGAYCSTSGQCGYLDWSGDLIRLNTHIYPAILLTAGTGGLQGANRESEQSVKISLLVILNTTIKVFQLLA